MNSHSVRKNKVSRHTKIIKKHHDTENGITISLTARYYNGIVSSFGVMVRGTSKQTREKRVLRSFSVLQAATEHFNKLIETPSQIFSATPGGLEIYNETVEKIVIQTERIDDHPKLGLLFAIDKRLRKSKNKDYLQHVDVLVRLLDGLHSIPSPYNDVEFTRWLKTCCSALFTKRIEQLDDKIIDGVIARDTAVHRKQMFVSALRRLIEFQHCFPAGAAYAAKAAIAEPIIKKELDITHAKSIRDRMPIKPYTKAEFEAYLNLAPTLATKLYILKTVAGTFRPKEAGNTKPQHIIAKNLLINEVATKKTSRKRVLVNPGTSLALRVLTIAEEKFGIKTTKEDIDWLSRSRKGFSLRPLRTTAVCNLLYCGASKELVRHRGGWSNSDTIDEHYNAFGLSDIGTKTPKDYYYGEDTGDIEIELQGKSVGNKEACEYDKYLLFMTLVTLSKHLPPDKIQILERIVLREDGQEAHKERIVKKFTLGSESDLTPSVPAHALQNAIPSQLSRF